MEEITSEQRWREILRDGAGFVFNDFSGDGSTGKRYNVLHEARCPYLGRANLAVPKYFFGDRREADEWLNRQRQENWKPCGTCCSDGKRRERVRATQPRPVRDPVRSNEGIPVVSEPEKSMRLEALLAFGDTLDPEDLVFKSNPLIGDLLRDDPFAFLLAASVDRGMAAETAWRLPHKIRAAIGHLDAAKIAEMSPQQMHAVLTSIDGRPRYLQAAARTIVEVARGVSRDCAGEARNLWRGEPAVVIRQRLTRFFGVGDGIAAMVLNLLASLKEIEFSAEDYTNIAVKPDVHVKRVFERLAFCARGSSEKQIVEVARRLHPAYPGKLDAPSWVIGRKWCHAGTPDCTCCPVRDSCPKLI